mmetsp:Transcript_8310/g.17622  ORF Transcript_8310/g.17622 Transcript_8310/m.17622 type:complete len:180 (-) Transcript_8310:241-780(-)
MSDRKARLAALAARAGRKRDIDVNSAVKPGSEGKSAEHENLGEKPDVKFRNYAPKDGALGSAGKESRQQKRKRSKTGEEGTSQAPTERTPLEVALIQAKLDARAAAVRSGEGGLKTAEDISLLAPKKKNWDLKRDIETKLTKLERRTQRAIVDLLRSRLEQEASEETSGMGASKFDDLD